MARATVIGSGPNGLVAAAVLARSGFDVEVLEAADAVGGGVRTMPGPLPGFLADVCSAVHPAAVGSPAFRALDVAQRVDWIVPEISYAHPLDGGEAAVAWRDIDRTAESLDADGRAWLALLRPLARRIDEVAAATGGSLLRIPRAPVTAVRFGLRMLEQGSFLGRRAFRTDAAAALIAGVMAHANAPLPSPAAAAAGLLLAAHGHARGWAFPHGGAQRIADALADDIRAHGGSIRTGEHVQDLHGLDWGDPRRGDVLMLSGSPRLALTHPGIPPAYERALRRYRYGPGAAKVDFALDGPVPWTNPLVAEAPTVHVGGTATEIAASEDAVARGAVSAHPYVLVVQPSVLDDSRAPEGRSALWAYIHVPAGSTLDPTELITAQIERFAPGFRDRILASHAVPASAREALNPAEIGGDIFGGAFDLMQAVRRPVMRRAPWRTPMPGVYLASAATPPGPGVTGMPGWHAARTVLRDHSIPLP